MQFFLLEAEGAESGKIVDANQAAAEMHGYSIDELMDLKIKDLEITASAKEASDRIQRMLKGEWVQAEINLRGKDGSVFPVEMRSGLIELGNRKYILNFGRNITIRKKSEKMQKLAAKQWENTFDAIQEMIVIVDKDRRIVQTNRAIRETFPDLNPQRQCYEIFHGGSKLPDGCVSCNIF